MNRAEYEAAREYLRRIKDDPMSVTHAAVLRLELSKGFDSDELDTTKKAALQIAIEAGKEIQK